MARLVALISDLERAIAEKTPYVSKIAHPALLVSTLKELRDLVGNETIKNDVADQTSFLITAANRGETDDDVMLNTVLFGGPGTGKTTIGTKMANIWYALGYLRRPAEEEKVFPVNLPDNESDLFNLLVAGIIVFSLLQPLVVIFYRALGPLYFVLALALLLFLVTVAFLYYRSSKRAGREKKISQMTARKAVQSSETLIKIVSREDFVDKYVGWTDKKTKALLEKSTGSVLFIDEAYSLLSDPRDMYGKEALNTLNRYMSENPRKVFVIMAGYKDLLQKTVFDAQPGLVRRFMWQFGCDGYSPDELLQIFLLQLGKAGWSLAPNDRPAIRALFEREEDAFPSQGGDVQRMTFFAQLAHSRSLVAGATLDKVLTYSHVAEGISTLRRNNIKKDDPASRMADFLRRASREREREREGRERQTVKIEEVY